MNGPALTALITIKENAGYFLPDRNFKTFGRDYRHLYRIMIEKLEAIDRITHIVINTDSDHVKQSYNRDSRFTVINTIEKRGEMDPPDLEIAPDKETVAMLAHARGDHFLRLGSVFPFVQHATLESAIGYYDRYILDPEDGRNDSLFSCSQFYRKLFDNDRDVLREDPPNVFIEDGILHLFNRKTFQEHGNKKVGKKPFAYTIEEIENLAIETEESYQLAELIAENRRKFPRIFR